MLVVLDTNYPGFHAALALRPAARVLDMLLDGDIQAAYDDRLLAEYREVLARPKFSFAPEDVAALLVVPGGGWRTGDSPIAAACVA